MWRQINSFAIRKDFSLDDCIDPSAKNFGIQDFASAENKPKPALSIEEEDTLLNTIDESIMIASGMTVIVFAIDTGVRHDGELNAIKPDDIDLVKRL